MDDRRGEIQARIDSRVEGSAGNPNDALRNVENMCGETYRSSFSANDHYRFHCLDAFGRYCALKQGHNQQQFDALKYDFEVLRSVGAESRCPTLVSSGWHTTKNRRSRRGWNPKRHQSSQ